ncbi:TauD/TfdA family dioxygenase [Curvivirga aplysinae]|uniref:TauD/TfdA family dioxygenase n=1 Tax=Curvivirga aplysinae TaxID=2529852 RepID=UPI0012BD09D5|nr:TauD/TfdA family dioxygenase [Curvivirga aplysinae]MTI11156.1 hypothetical protein [Curvivirga aplysinae]
MPDITLPENDQPYVLYQASETDNLSELDVEKVKALYKEHGAILFRGFEWDVPDFKDLTSKFCSHGAHNSSIGRDIVDREHIIQSVNLGNEAFPLHPEMSAQPWKPDVCWFACQKPTISGGETTICDGVEIIKALPNEMVEELKSKKIKYVLPTEMDEIKYWLNTNNVTREALDNMPEDCPFEFFKMENALYKSYVTDFFHETMFQSKLAFGNFILFARYLNNRMNYPLYEDNSIIPEEISAKIKEVSDPLTAPINWEKHDIIMIDNSRFLHGRNEVMPMDDRYILTYFGYLNFAELSPRDQKQRWRKPGFFRF